MRSDEAQGEITRTGRVNRSILSIRTAGTESLPAEFEDRGLSFLQLRLLTVYPRLLVARHFASRRENMAMVGSITFSKNPDHSSVTTAHH